MLTKLKIILCTIITMTTMNSECVYSGCEAQNMLMPVEKNSEITECNIVEVKENISENNEVEDIITETKIEINNDDKEEFIEAVTEKIEPLFYLSDYERWTVECIVMGESEGEPYEGQILVAQCILNACLKDELQPSKVREKYKYVGWNENPSESVKKAVSSVFDFGEKIIDEPILYFYAPSLCQSKWHETQKFVIEIGNHKFFKENN